MSATYSADTIWCRSHFDTMADGGIWAVPRSGLIFTRRGEALELTSRMPWTEEIARAAVDDWNVPANAEALRAYQDADYDLIRSRFEQAGITVRDALDGAAS
jgi:hypothetical protein